MAARPVIDQMFAGKILAYSETAAAIRFRSSEMAVLDR